MTRARDVMTRRVLTVREQTPVGDAAALLVKYRFTALPVVDGSGFLIGIVSEADLVADPTEGRTGTPCTVGGVMTRDVIFMFPETDLDRLRHWLLSLGLRVMPITDHHRRLVGIVTRMDLLLRDHPVIARFNLLDWAVQRAKRLVGARQRTTDQAAHAPPPPAPPSAPAHPADVRSAGQSLRARHVMTRHPVSVQETTTVEAAIELLEDYRFTALPVVDTEGHLVGIVSGAD
ncbi:MAG TPA: CBS domain-containing protein, partial [Pseudonocardiaceae bacterium]|nr:CBS domain-containing protein [Pseudonocardiaceae bacterium]